MTTLVYSDVGTLLSSRLTTVPYDRLPFPLPLYHPLKYHVYTLPIIYFLLYLFTDVENPYLTTSSTKQSTEREGSDIGTRQFLPSTDSLYRSF